MSILFAGYLDYTKDLQSIIGGRGIFQFIASGKYFQFVRSQELYERIHSLMVFGGVEDENLWSTQPYIKGML